MKMLKTNINNLMQLQYRTYFSLTVYSASDRSKSQFPWRTFVITTQQTTHDSIPLLTCTGTRNLTVHSV